MYWVAEGLWQSVRGQILKFLVAFFWVWILSRREHGREGFEQAGTLCLDLYFRKITCVTQWKMGREKEDGGQEESSKKLARQMALETKGWSWKIFRGQLDERGDSLDVEGKGRLQDDP